jgi:hypothetical protein
LGKGEVAADEALPHSDDLGKGVAKKAAVNGEIVMPTSPKLDMAIGKPKYHRRNDSGYVATGKSKGTKKAAIPTAAAASRK